MDKLTNPKYKIPWLNIVVVFLLAGLLASVIWFAIDIRFLYKNGAFSSASGRIHKRNTTRPTISISQIQSWMTFRYIQYVFHLPTNYLSDKLKITDANYSNLTLSKYSSLHKLKISVFLQSVKDAVTDYQAITTP